MASSALIKALAVAALVSCAMLLAGCGEAAPPPEKPRRSAVGLEAVEASTHCANEGGECKCDGGFVIYGAGTHTQDFDSREDFAKWDVYPKRLGSEPISCTPKYLGAPYSFGSHDKIQCRCVSADLKCKQLTKPWANGCGAGGTSKFLNLGMKSDQIKCCNGHDICYSLCGKTKLGCDDEFDSCLAKTCGGHACKAKIQMMGKAVRNIAGETAYSAAQRHDELFSLTGGGKKLEKTAAEENKEEKKAAEDVVTEKKAAASEDKKEKKADERLYSTGIDAAFGRLTSLGAIVTSALLTMAVIGYVVRIRHARAIQYGVAPSTQDDDDEPVEPLIES